MVRVRDIGSKILHMRNLNRKDTGYIQFTEDNGVSIFLLPISGFILKSTTTSDLLHRNRDWNAKAPRLDIPHCCKSRAVKYKRTNCILYILYMSLRFTLCFCFQNLIGFLILN
jgi:hypothetical protein